MLDFFRVLKQSFKLIGYPAVTLHLSPSRYRIADVAVFHGGLPAENWRAARFTFSSNPTPCCAKVFLPIIKR